MTELKKETIRLIWLGNRSLDIVNELISKFDVPSADENALYKIIADIRKEIEDFRARAPGLAEQCFTNGDDWKTAISKFEEVGLISSFEFVGICSRAWNRVHGIQESE